MVAWTVVVVMEAVKSNQVLYLLWKQNYGDFLIGCVGEQSGMTSGFFTWAMEGWNFPGLEEEENEGEAGVWEDQSLFLMCET